MLQLEHRIIMAMACGVGIEEEGIFRVNGNVRVMEKLRDSFEKHGDADLESTEDIFSVAGLLKQFLRELPEAVIPEELTSKFVKCQEGLYRNLRSLLTSKQEWAFPLISIFSSIKY